MRIEFDPDKDRINIARHDGLSLADVERVDWDEAIHYPDDRFAYGEARISALVPLGNRLCHVTFIERGEDWIRVISLRYAEKTEVAFYVQNYR
jgi:uncharacterized DUF497 family protein